MVSLRKIGSAPISALQGMARFAQAGFSKASELVTSYPKITAIGVAVLGGVAHATGWTTLQTCTSLPSSWGFQSTLRCEPTVLGSVVEKISSAASFLITTLAPYGDDLAQFIGSFFSSETLIDNVLLGSLLGVVFSCWMYRSRNIPERIDLDLPNIDDTQYPQAILDLSNKQLTDPPDVSSSQYRGLSDLDLAHNQLDVAPDVSKNPKLKFFDLSNNKLRIVPNVSGNSELEYLDLSNNLLTELDSSILELPRRCRVVVWGNSLADGSIAHFTTRLMQHRIAHPNQGPEVEFLPPTVF